MAATDAALATLAAAAPGAEAAALQALNDALDPPALEALMCVAETALHQFAVRCDSASGPGVALMFISIV